MLSIKCKRKFLLTSQWYAQQKLWTSCIWSDKTTNLKLMHTNYWYTCRMAITLVNILLGREKKL